jgi:hypothetical protein
MSSATAPSSSRSLISSLFAVMPIILLSWKASVDIEHLRYEYKREEVFSYIIKYQSNERFLDALPGRS